MSMGSVNSITITMWSVSSISISMMTIVVVVSIAIVGIVVTSTQKRITIVSITTKVSGLKMFILESFIFYNLATYSSLSIWLRPSFLILSHGGGYDGCNDESQELHDCSGLLLFGFHLLEDLFHNLDLLPIYTNLMSY